MRYGLAELLLVQPGATAYRAPPGPDAPGVRAALKLARRQPGPGAAEIDNLTWGAAQVYAAVRNPERLTAPPPWPQELALLLAESVLAAFGERMRTWRTAVVAGPPIVAAGLAIGALRRRAERAQARRLGLTALTAPQRYFGAHAALLSGAMSAYWFLRLTRRIARPQRLPWWLLAATQTIRRLDEGRSWQRAYAAAAGRSAHARSSAESSASGGWAPETP